MIGIWKNLDKIDQVFGHNQFSFHNLFKFSQLIYY